MLSPEELRLTTIDPPSCGPELVMAALWSSSGMPWIRCVGRNPAGVASGASYAPTYFRSPVCSRPGSCCSS